MREADVTGLDMDMVSPRTTRDTQERDVRVIRLENDAELRVCRASAMILPQSFVVLWRSPVKKSHTHL